MTTKAQREVAMRRPFRFLVKEMEHASTESGPVWEVYKCYSDDSIGEIVGYLTDKDSVELLLEAPAMRQLQNNLRKMSGVPAAKRLLLEERSYTPRTLRSFSESFVGFLRRL